MIASPLEYGVIGGILVAIWRLLDVAKVMFLNRKGVAADGDITHQQILTVLVGIAERQKRVDNLIGPKGEGPFDCAWHGRDEVNKFMVAIDNLATETRLLREEIQRDRQARANGK